MRLALLIILCAAIPANRMLLQLHDEIAYKEYNNIIWKCVGWVRARAKVRVNMAAIRIQPNVQGYFAIGVRSYVESPLNSLHLTAQMLVKIGMGAMNCYVEYGDIEKLILIHFN